MITIRDLEHDDVENGFLECLNALSPSPRLDAIWAKSVISLRKQQAAATKVAVDEQGKVVGTVSVLFEIKFTRGGCFVGHIEDVAVHPDRQGLGIGQQLVLAAINLCKSRGCYKAILDCDSSLVPFYGKFGFKKHEVGMRLDLSCGDSQSQQSSATVASNP